MMDPSCAARLDTETRATRYVARTRQRKGEPALTSASRRLARMGTTNGAAEEGRVCRGKIPCGWPVFFLALKRHSPRPKPGASTNPPCGCTALFDEV